MDPVPELQISRIPPGYYRLLIESSHLSYVSEFFEIGDGSTDLGVFKMSRTGTLLVAIEGLEAWPSPPWKCFVRTAESEEWVDMCLIGGGEIQTTLPGGQYVLILPLEDGVELESGEVTVHEGQATEFTWQVAPPQ